MKRLLILTTAALALAGCGQPQPASRYSDAAWDNAYHLRALCLAQWGAGRCSDDVERDYMNPAWNVAVAADISGQQDREACSGAAGFGLPFSYGNRTAAAIYTGCLMGKAYGY